jgi:hypothetical protein
MLQLPTAQVQMMVGEMWEDYLVWKEPQLQPTTFKAAFLGTYTNPLNGMEWDVKTKTFNRVIDPPLAKAEGILRGCYETG